MKVTFYGHACFRLEGTGVSIITDPYTPGSDASDASGLDPVTATADYVVMSSALDAAHSNAAMIGGNPRVVNALDAVSRDVELADGVVVHGILAGEGADRPDAPKANALYTFTLDGIRVCHMGDVGNPLDESQLAPLVGNVDLLFALAGGNLTIALDDLDAAIDAIDPRVVIPMHYRTPSIRYTVGTVEEFLDHRNEPVTRLDGDYELDAASLPAGRELVVMRPRCDPLATV